MIRPDIEAIRKRAEAASADEWVGDRMTRIMDYDIPALVSYVAELERQVMESQAEASAFRQLAKALEDYAAMQRVGRSKESVFKNLERAREAVAKTLRSGPGGGANGS